MKIIEIYIGKNSINGQMNIVYMDCCMIYQKAQEKLRESKGYKMFK